jgi:hypothetical protein
MFLHQFRNFGEDGIFHFHHGSKEYIYIPLGTFVAAQTILSTIEGVEQTPLNSVTITDDGFCSGDLANMLGMVTKYSDDISYKISGYNVDVACEQTDYVLQSNLAYSKYESDAENNLTILFIGDSFLGSMEQYLSTDFTKTIFVHRDNYKSLEEDLILEELPDIVVFQTAERFLADFDDYMRRYGTMYSE